MAMAINEKFNVFISRSITAIHNILSKEGTPHRQALGPSRSKMT